MSAWDWIYKNDQIRLKENDSKNKSLLKILQEINKKEGQQQSQFSIDPGDPGELGQPPATFSANDPASWYTAADTLTNPSINFSAMANNPIVSALLGLAPSGIKSGVGILAQIADAAQRASKSEANEDLSSLILEAGGSWSSGSSNLGGDYGNMGYGDPGDTAAGSGY